MCVKDWLFEAEQARLMLILYMPGVTIRNAVTETRKDLMML
jgi:hypothetical protein